jgi:hypothetical protein
MMPSVQAARRPRRLWGRRPTNRCSEPRTHKVLGRGRPSLLLTQALRARVLTRQPAVAELNRWATGESNLITQIKKVSAVRVVVGVQVAA